MSVSSSRMRRVAAGALLLAGLFALYLPLLLRDQLEQAIVRLGAERVRIGAVRLQPLAGRIALDDVQVWHAGRRRLVLAEAALDLRWGALLDGALHLERVRLRDADLLLERVPGGTLLLPVPVPAADAGAGPAPAASDWALVLDTLELQNVRIGYREPTFDTGLLLSYASLRDVHTGRTGLPVLLALYGRIAGGGFRVGLDGLPLAAPRRVQADLDFTGVRVPDFVAGLIGAQRLDGALGGELRLTVTQTDGSLALEQDGDLTLSALHLAHGATRIAAAALRWQGPVRLTLVPGQVPRLQLEGALALGRLALAQSGAGELELVRLAWDGSVGHGADGGVVAGRLELSDVRAAAEAGRAAAGSLRWQGEMRAARTLAVNGRLDLEAVQAEAAGGRLAQRALAWDGTLERSADGTIGAVGRLVTGALEARFADAEAAHGGLTWDGELTYGGDGGLAASGELALRELHARRGPDSVAERGLTWRGTVQGFPARAVWQADGELDGVGLAATLSDQWLALERGPLHWRGRVEVEGGALALAASGRVNGVAVRRGATELVRFEHLDVAGLTLRPGPDLALDQLALANLDLLRAADEPAPLARTPALDLTGIAWSGSDGVVVDGVALAGGRIELARDADGRLRLPPLGAPAGAAASAPGPAADEPPPRLRIGAFSSRAPLAVHFRDAAVQPPFTSELVLERLEVGALDSHAPDAQTPIAVSGTLDGYAPMRLQGWATPLAEAPGVALHGGAESLDLARLSPYAERFLGYTLRSGHLDAELDLGIDRGALDGDTRLTLRQLQLVMAGERAEGLNSALSMPLDAALDLLRDGDGRIALEVPIGGDLDNPQFDPADAINQALGGAMKKAALAYLKYALQPYGTLITVAEYAGKLNRIQLDPVPFAPGAAEIGDTAYLERIGGLLREKEALSLRLCSRVVAADERALRERRAQERPNKAGEKSAEAAAEPVPQEALLALGRARGEAVKRVLVRDYAIAPGRLLLCNPAVVAQEQDPPRLELLI